MRSAADDALTRAPGSGAEVAVVVVNWNGGDLLRRCVDSVLRHPPSRPFEIVLIDNCSTDDSADGLAVDRNLRLIRNRSNLGFARACNQGVAATEAAFILFLNPDAEVHEGAVDRLVAALQRHPRAAAAGPRILNPDGTVQRSVGRNPPTPWEILLEGLRLSTLIPQPWRGRLLLGSHWPHDRARDVPDLGGAAILARREALQHVGGFDERVHLFLEDAEWCLRARRAAWRLRFDPGAVVTHEGGASWRQRWDRATQHQVQLEAYLDFQRRSLGRAHFAANLAAIWLTLTAARLRSPGRDRPELAAGAAACRRELFRLVRTARGPHGGAPVARGGASLTPDQGHRS